MNNRILEYLKGFNYKKLIVPGIFLIMYASSFIFLYYRISNYNDKNVVNEVTNNLDLSYEEEMKEYIYVDIKGEIEKPGVYKLELGSRVNDLIEMSGGLKKNANTRFINLSKELKDGDAIVIYSNKEIEDAKKDKTIIVETPCVCEEINNDACVVENISSESNIENSTNMVNGKVNINTATIEELTTLSGIGESKAKAIIEYRIKNGLYSSIEDIKKVNGISETIYSKIKENINI